MSETKVDKAGGQEAGKPAQPVPGVTREPPPANPSDPDSPPAATGLDSKVEAEPVEMPKSALEGGTNVVSVPGKPQPASKK